MTTEKKDTKKKPESNNLITVEAVKHVTVGSACYIPGDRFQVSEEKAADLKDLIKTV